MRWTRKTIIVEIQRLHKGGTELNYAAAESNYLNLVRAAAWHFGTWRRAVEQAGIDYESLSKYQRWDRHRIISRIRELHQDKADLSWRSVSTEVDPPLAAAALRPNGFASWRDAIAAAGLNINEVARYRNWSSEQVLREIKALHRSKQPLSSKAIQTSNQPLFCAARRRFGSWDAALAEAGLNAGKIRLRQPADRRLELGLVDIDSTEPKRGRTAKALLNGHPGSNGKTKIAAGVSDNARQGSTSRRKTQLDLPLPPAKTKGRQSKAASSAQAVLEFEVPKTRKAVIAASKNAPTRAVATKAVAPKPKAAASKSVVARATVKAAPAKVAATPTPRSTKASSKVAPAAPTVKAATTKTAVKKTAVAKVAAPKASATKPVVAKAAPKPAAAKTAVRQPKATPAKASPKVASSSTKVAAPSKRRKPAS